MKQRQMIPKRKLRATAVRRSNAPSRAIEEEEEEPTMRLSSAFMVVVVLHLVAIGGIITFEKVKVNRANSTVEETAKIIGAAAPVTPAAAPVTPAVAPREVAAAPATLVSHPAPAQEVRKPAPVAAANHATTSQSAHAAHSLKDSGEVHVVAKGENPVAIAKKHGVSYEDLLKLNKIEDPRKLQPGQKLRIPAKAK